MSVKRRDKDDKESNWYYRFTYKGEDFCEGGFRTSGQAAEAERLALNLAIEREQHPEAAKGKGLTFRQAGQWWLDNHTADKRSKKNDFCRMPLAISYFGDKLLRDITVTDIGVFLSKLPELRDKKVSDHTKNHYRALLHALYERLRETDEYAGKNVVKSVKKIKVPTARTRFIYPSEEKLLTPLMGQHEAIFAYYLLGIETGMRIGEMRAARVKHVDLLLGHIFVPDPKNRRSRYVPFVGALRPFLERFITGKGPEDFLLPQWCYTYLRDRFHAICLAAGIRLEKNEAWHVLRHTFAYNHLSQGTSIYKVSLLMGHSSIDVTQKHYGHLAAKDLREAAESVKPFLSCNRFATGDEIYRTIINEIASKNQSDGAVAK